MPMNMEDGKSDLFELEKYIKDMWLFLPVPLVYLNSLGVILGLSTAVPRILGRSEEEIIGSPLSDYFADKHVILGILREVSDDQTVSDRECLIANAKGDKISVSVSAMLRKDENGEMIGSFVAFVDMTEHRRVEDELRLSEEKYRVLVENSPIGLYYSDLQGRFLYGNKQAENMVGFKREELIGKNFLKLKLLDPRDIPRAAKLLALNNLSRSTGPDKFNLTKKDGSKIMVEISTTIINYQGQKAVLGMVNDITERKQAEELLQRQARDLEDANEKLRELDRMKSNFLSNVSHELRTPLASIKGFVETIVRERDMDEETRQEFLEIVMLDSERLNLLINRLLNLSRLEIGKIKLKKENIDLLAVIRDVIASFGTQARLKKLTLIVELPQNLPLIYADPQYIKEVLVQLVDNSIKYTESEGCITVSVWNKDSDVVISVTDTGIGIPENELPHIFDMFYKVERPAEQVGGIGLGMALVKYIVEAHGGRIRLESKVGKGTKFSFNLPRG
jgi:PAS domain S-box-containing protein